MRRNKVSSMSQTTGNAPREKFRVRTKALLALSVILLIVFAIVSRWDTAQKNPATAPAPAVDAPEVTVETVRKGSHRTPIRVTGVLRTDEMVTLSTKATGVVKAVLVREGDRVRRGQLLMVVDDRDLRAQRDRAVAGVRAGESQIKEMEAALRSAEGRLEQARTGRTIKNAAAQAVFRRSEEDLATAQARLSQAQSLSGIAATEAETRVASAGAALQAARERLKVLTEGARRQERAAGEAAVARAQVQAKRMKSMLERREQLQRAKAVAAEVVDNARRDHEAALADLESARQMLSLLREGPRTEEVRAQEEIVRQGEALLREAEANRARHRISNEDVDVAQSQVRQAQASLDAARANLSQSEVNEDEIRNAQSAVVQAAASLERARSTADQSRADVRLQDELIKQTRIYSPVNGVVTKRNVQEGAAVVQMRNELMTLVSSDTLYLEATAPETSLPQLRPNLRAQVLLDAAPGRVFPGVLREIIRVAEGANRSVRLRISIPRPVREHAVVGGFARAEIEGVSSTATVSVPRAALVSEQGQFSVFVFVNGTAVRRPVTFGDPGGLGDRVPVTDGLLGGEQVVVEGAASLADGQAVTARPQDGL